MTAYIGVDFHARQQTISYLTTEDGEILRLQLDHGQPAEVRRFCQQFAGQKQNQTGVRPAICDSHGERASPDDNIVCADCDPGGGGGGGATYPSDPYFGTARTRPENETGDPGVTLGSRNFN